MYRYWGGGGGKGGSPLSHHTHRPPHAPRPWRSVLCASTSTADRATHTNREGMEEDLEKGRTTGNQWAEPLGSSLWWVLSTLSALPHMVKDLVHVDVLCPMHSFVRFCRRN